jgi:hypothetical protein
MTPNEEGPTGDTFSLNQAIDNDSGTLTEATRQ